MTPGGGLGELRTGGAVAGYYRTATRSIGPQIGAQSKALVLLFMRPEALSRFRNTGTAWLVGADALVELLKVGANGEIDANVAQSPTVVFVLIHAFVASSICAKGSVDDRTSMMGWWCHAMVWTRTTALRLATPRLSNSCSSIDVTTALALQRASRRRQRRDLASSRLPTGSARSCRGGT